MRNVFPELLLNMYDTQYKIISDTTTKSLCIYASCGDEI